MRPTLDSLVALLLLGLAGCGTQVATPTPTPPVASVPAPAVRLTDDGRIQVSDLPAPLLSSLASAERTPEQWAALLRVTVDGKSADVPPLLGSYKVEGTTLAFQPRFPLRPGVRYRVVFDPGALAADVSRVETVVGLPRPEVPPTAVTQIYPTRAALPENQLKFYIHFSAPMSRQDVYDHVRLLDAQGKPIPDCFVQVPEGLWAPDGRRCTMILHPGRIKRGLKPREELGPILEEGKTYILEVDSRWTDAEGQPLRETVRKTFRALAPDDRQPDHTTWKVQPPAAGTAQPLVVTFPEPLDSALAAECLWVVDSKGVIVEGTVALAEEETRWLFTPKEPWRGSAYQLMIDSIIEDLAGNCIAHPFEVDVFKPVTQRIETKTVSLPFTVVPK